MNQGQLTWTQWIDVSYSDDFSVIELTSQFVVLDQNAPSNLGNSHRFFVPSDANQISVEEYVTKRGTDSDVLVAACTLEGEASDFHLKRHDLLLYYPRTKSLRGLDRFRVTVRYQRPWTRPPHAEFPLHVPLAAAVLDYLDGLDISRGSQALNSLLVHLKAPIGCRWDQTKSPKNAIIDAIRECGFFGIPDSRELTADPDVIHFSLRPNATGITAGMVHAKLDLAVAQDAVELVGYADRITNQVTSKPAQDVVTFVCDLRGSTGKTSAGKPSLDVLRYHGIWRRNQLEPYLLLKIVGDLVLAVCDPGEFLASGLQDILDRYQRSLDLGFPIRGGFHIGKAMAAGNPAETFAGSVIGQDFLGDALNHGAKIGDYKENDNGIIASQAWVNWIARSGMAAGEVEWKIISIAGTATKLYRIDPSALTRSGRAMVQSELQSFPDRLIARAKQRTSRLIVGLDPDVERFPGYLKSQWQRNPSLFTLEEIIFRFNTAIIDATKSCAAAYKPQIAFYEQYGLAGYRALLRTIQYLRQNDELIVLDAKRNDIEHTARAYADAWLSEVVPFTGRLNEQRVDAITVNGYLGSDGILPFLEANPLAGIFVLAKTSNPSSQELQDLRLDKSRLFVSQEMARLANEWGERGGIGESGYARVGMVVGATHPDACRELRRLAPKAIFLMPGLGAQGGAPGSVAISAGDTGFGAFASSSRSVLYGFDQKRTDSDVWSDAVSHFAAEEARRLRDTINSEIGK